MATHTTNQPAGFSLQNQDPLSMGMPFPEQRPREAYPHGLPNTNTPQFYHPLCKRKGLKANKICSFTWFSRSRDEINDANLPVLTTRAFLAVSYRITGRVDYVMYLAVWLKVRDKS